MPICLRKLLVLETSHACPRKMFQQIVRDAEEAIVRLHDITSRVNANADVRLEALLKKLVLLEAVAFGAEQPKVTKAQAVLSVPARDSGKPIEVFLISAAETVDGIRHGKRV